jgi:hypothetical protein
MTDIKVNDATGQHMASECRTQWAGLDEITKSVADLTLASGKQVPYAVGNEVVTWIDPCGDTMVLVSMACQKDGSFLVVGLSEAENKSFAEMNQTLTSHFGALRAHAVTKKATFVQVVDNNYGGSIFAQTIQKLVLDGFSPAISLDETAERPGVCITSRVKQEILAYGQEQWQKGRVHLLDKWASTATTDRARGELIHQTNSEFQSTHANGAKRENVAFGICACMYWTMKRPTA